MVHLSIHSFLTSYRKFHIHLSFLPATLPFFPLTESEFPTIVIPIGLFPPLFAVPSLLAVRRKDGGGGKAKLVAGRQEIFLLPLLSFLLFRRSSPTYQPTLPYVTRLSRLDMAPHHAYSSLVSTL